MKMKKPLIIGLSLLLYANIQAQEAGHYLYLNVGGGLHNLSYSLQNGNEKGSFGYSFNAGYGYFFNKHWGVQTGVGLQSLKPTATLNYMTGVPSTDADGATYEYRTYYNNWKEQQSLLFLDIPLGVQYRYKLNGKFQLLAAAGLKISFPVKTTYKTTGGEIVTSGYYSQWNVELKNMPRHGFNTITDQLTGDVSLKPSYSGFADLGATYMLSSKLDLYAGGSINYGLNNVLKSGNKLVYQQDGVYNGVLASNQTDKAKMVSLGMKVGVIWHFGYKKAVTELKIENELPAAKKTVIVEKVPETPKAAIAEQPVAIVTSTPEITPKEAVYINAKTIAVSTQIKFKFNSGQLASSEYLKIKALSDILKTTPGMSLRIVGHTCNLGSRKVNLKVGLKRAVTVKKLFLKEGVSNSQLLKETKSFDDPLLPNTSMKNRKQNRRVTLIVE